MKKQMYSASDIAKMNIPDLPASRQNISVRAEREGWYSEERIGIGGKRKVYEIPQHYLGRLSGDREPLDQNSRPQAARHITSHNRRSDLINAGESLDRPVDMALMRTAIEIVEHALAEQGLAALPEIKSRMATLIYQLAEAKGWHGALTAEQQAVLRQAIA